MTLAGWLFMSCSIGLVISAVVYCFWRVLTRPAASGHMHAPLDIDVHDRDLDC